MNYWLKIGQLYADQDYTMDLSEEMRKLKRAALMLEMDWERIISPVRSQPICDFRFMACKHLRDKGYTYREIADVLHRGDHSTCIYQYKQANALIETDRVFRRKWVTFKQA